MKNKAVAAIIILFVLFTFICFSWAQEKIPASEQLQSKEKYIPDEGSQEVDAFTVETVSGEVSGMTGSSISLVYDRDYDSGAEYEVLIPYGADIKIKHKKSLDEIKVGDLISIEYEKPVEGSKKSSKARTITFIQPGVSGLTTRAQ